MAFATLPAAVAAQDPLVVGCANMGEAWALDPSRVGVLADELFTWLEGLIDSTAPPEPRQERRLRHCICLLADIGWRAHPDFRGPRSLELIAHATLTGVDHGGRAFMALAVYFSHKPRVEGELCARLAGLVGKSALAQARKLGAALRLAEALCAARPGLLPRSSLTLRDECLTLSLQPGIAGLGGLRLEKRLSYLAGLTGRNWAVEIKKP